MTEVRNDTQESIINGTSMVSLTRSPGLEMVSKNPYKDHKHILVKELKLTSSHQYRSEEAFDEWCENIEIKSRGLDICAEKHKCPTVRSTLPATIMILVEPLIPYTNSWKLLTDTLANIYVIQL